MRSPISRYAERLLDAGVAGKRTSHGAENNLRKIGLLLEGDANNTFGMEELLADTTSEEAYAAVEALIGNAPDAEETPGRGCIDPARTTAGLLEAGERIRDAARAGKSFVLATGHPGALLSYYLDLSRWVEDLGGEVLSTQTEGRYKRGAILDWVGGVGALGDGATLWHSHDPEPMRDLLRELGAADFVVADHGFAGAAAAAGIPTVAIMDTNDPAFAVAAGRGADLSVVPMDDNRPQGAYAAALSVLTGGA